MRRALIIGVGLLRPFASMKAPTLDKQDLLERQSLLDDMLLFSERDMNSMPFASLALSLTGSRSPCEARFNALREDIAQRATFWLRTTGRQIRFNFHGGLKILNPKIFLANRILTYPTEGRDTVKRGIHELGGVISAFENGWLFFTEQLMSTEDGDEISLFIEGKEDGDVYNFANVFSSRLNVDIHLDDDMDMPACLVETRDRRSIYLDRNLGLKRRSFSILHELAHIFLDHEEASSHILDVDERFLWKHQRQECEADALADILLHIFSGLREVARQYAQSSAYEQEADMPLAKSA